MELLLFPFMLCITESAPFQPRRRAYRWRKSCSTRSKGSCVQSGVRCRGGAFVGITSPVKCKNSADSMALSISVTVCHCAEVGRASTKVSNSSASSRSSARTNSGSRPSPAGSHRSYTPLRRHGAGKTVPFGSLHPAPAPLGRKPKSAAPRSKMPGNGRWRGSSETGRGQYPAHPDPPPPRGTGQNAARYR